MIEGDGSRELTYFWNENLANLSIIQTLIEGDVKVPSEISDNDFILEAKDIDLSLIDNNTTEDAVKPQENLYIAEPDLICFSDENNDFFPNDDQTGSGQRLDRKKVRTGENAHCAIDFDEIKINVSIHLWVLNNKMVHAVQRPKP